MTKTKAKLIRITRQFDFRLKKWVFVEHYVLY